MSTVRMVHFFTKISLHCMPVPPTEGTRHSFLHYSWDTASRKQVYFSHRTLVETQSAWERFKGFSKEIDFRICPSPFMLMSKGVHESCSYMLIVINYLRPSEIRFSYEPDDCELTSITVSRVESSFQIEVLEMSRWYIFTWLLHETVSFHHWF